MTNPSRKIQLQLVKTSPIGIRLPGSGGNVSLSSSMFSRAALTKFEFEGMKKTLHKPSRIWINSWTLGALRGEMG